MSTRDIIVGRLLDIACIVGGSLLIGKASNWMVGVGTGLIAWGLLTTEVNRRLK